jgi:energy-coupling factor transporter ATP-binding protein EcfA2
MRIESVHLRNFKRFTDLLISGIPNTARLVVVVGPAGCGKSSLFDAFLHWYRQKVGLGFHGDELYYRKDSQQPFKWDESVKLTLHGNVSPKRGSLYVRTAYRNDPDFSVSGITRPDVPTDRFRFNRIIENDQSVSDNYHRLVYETTAALYDPANDSKTVQTLREELIGHVRASMKRVFGNLLLNNISDPLGSGAFFFEKGTIASFHYKNLSGGEKAAFDLLLDLHVKKKYFSDAVYCIDEVETHLHTRIQGVLVRELLDILPGDSQLWVTTHSLGVLRAAQEMDTSAPGSVCIFDFEGIDPDIPTELLPVTLGRVAWDKLLSITLDDLSEQIAPKVVVVCEGSSIGTRRKDFDAEIYNRIFGPRVTDILFVSGGSSDQLLGTGISVRKVLDRILPRTKVIPLVDRDDKSPAEIAEWEEKGGIVLSERNLESYLFADEVIEALVKREGKQSLLDDALKIKSNALDRSVARGNAPDDIKSAAGEIYTNLKKLLGLQRAGNNTDAFMRDTLAPLIVPGMETYRKLKADIVDKIA